LLGLVKVRQTFCIFNLISSPKILADLSQRNHNPKPLQVITEQAQKNQFVNKNLEFY